MAGTTLRVIVVVAGVQLVQTATGSILLEEVLPADAHVDAQSLVEYPCHVGRTAQAAQRLATALTTLRAAMGASWLKFTKALHACASANVKSPPPEIPAKTIKALDGRFIAVTVLDALCLTER